LVEEEDATGISEEGYDDLHRRIVDAPLAHLNACLGHEIDHVHDHHAE
tara:strand:+ start:691 stop:834 length:144 start_codon:yes stop_codon:yes gene_type:complete